MPTRFRALTQILSSDTAAARLLGVSQPGLTGLLSLLLLAPTIQQAILAGMLAPGDKELRRMARIAAWSDRIEGCPRS